MPELIVNEQTVLQNDQIQVPEDISINHNNQNADVGTHSGVISEIAR